MESSTTRRELLVATGATVSLTGCTSFLDDSDDDASDDADASDDDGGSTDGTGDGTSTDGTGDGTSTDGTGDGNDPLADLPDAVALEPVAEGFTGPVAFASSPVDDLHYVLEQGGRIQAIGPDGRLDEPVLDLSDRITTGFEMGLLGIELHPEFASNRRAFLRYSSPAREGTPGDYSHTFVLSEFVVGDDGSTIDPATERTILEIPQPQGNHNAGDLAFGPDGLLYVPTGDGGAANDQGTGHVQDWYGEVDGGNGQDVTENLLGAILRIDVDAEPTEHPRTDADAPDAPEGDGGYAIPGDNPLVGEAGLDEHYAWGLRNPWRLSFDAGDEGGDGDSDDGASAGDWDCYVADVGQDGYEEVNLLEAGGNYGWNVREGAHCFQAEECPTETPSDVRGGEALLDPVVEYTHESGEVTGDSIIGGHVYRGEAVPDLSGAYVFGDFNAGGQLFASRSGEEGELWPITTVDATGAQLQTLFAFGRDGDGELYVLGAAGENGVLWRLAPDE